MPPLHAVRRYQQTADAVCGPTALAMQLSSVGFDLSPGEVVRRAAGFRRAGDAGFTTQELAAFCLSLGLEVELHSFDGRVLDYAWSRLDRSDLESRLTALCVHLRASRPSTDARLRYAEGYLSLVRAGGVLRIATHPRRALLLDLLDRGPVGAGLLDNVLSGTGKRDASGAPDPLDGQVGTHSVLLVGADADGFLLADPALPADAALRRTDTETLLAAVTAAQVDDDNSVLLVTR
ncbi:hypothetical protein [Kineosporia sp. R_H_3]|uniref:hypothetical protein n=1 Tax=Kineosporia sp. R_H_3 TaxID=1961848 RepID=UPI00117A31BF|nr:hypothetical protein [Kineosporia sp. R_H_3]